MICLFQFLLWATSTSAVVALYAADIPQPVSYASTAITKRGGYAAYGRPKVWYAAYSIQLHNRDDGQSALK